MYRTKKRRYCPVCKYVVSEIVITLKRYDYPCPRCGQTTLSMFVPEAVLKLDISIRRLIKAFDLFFKSFRVTLFHSDDEEK